MSRPCKWCGEASHTQFYCKLKPRTRIAVKKLPSKQGKVTKQWLLTRQTWFRKHPAALYECYLCGRTLEQKDTTLDHIKSRSRHPELRYDLDNLAPCCWTCNQMKGSKDI